MGLVRPELLAEVDAALSGIAARQPPACGLPTVLAYGHYPLGTLEQPPRTWPGPLGLPALALRSASSMQGLAALLAARNVAAYLSGHLHAAFGARLHALHPTPAGGQLAELETTSFKEDRRFRLVALDPGSAVGLGGGGDGAALAAGAPPPPPTALTFIDLYFHGPGTPTPRGQRPDLGAMEHPAWRERRAARGWGVTPGDPSATVVDYIALITSPADARYAPLLPPSVAEARAAAEAPPQGAVRALVFPLDGPAAEALAAGARRGGGGVLSWLSGGSGVKDAVAAVSLTVALPGGGLLASEPMALLEGQEPQVAAAAKGSVGPLLFEARPVLRVNCSSGDGNASSVGEAEALCQAAATAGEGVAGATEHVVDLQVVVADAWRASASPRQPAGLRCTAIDRRQQQQRQQLRCVVSSLPPGGRPLPLGVSWLEWLVLAVSWPVAVHRLFLAAWAFQLGALLLLPRLGRRRWAPTVAAAPLFRPGGGSSGSASGVAARLARCASAWLAWPVASLALLADAPRVWWPMVGYRCAGCRQHDVAAAAAAGSQLLPCSQHTRSVSQGPRLSGPAPKPRFAAPTCWWAPGWWRKA